MYTASIIWFASWPIFIFATYRLILFALRKFDKVLNTESV